MVLLLESRDRKYPATAAGRRLVRVCRGSKETGEKGRWSDLGTARRHGRELAQRHDVETD